MKDWFSSKELRRRLVREGGGKGRMSFGGIIKFTLNVRTSGKNLGSRFEDFGICFSGSLVRLQPIATLGGQLDCSHFNCYLAHPVYSLGVHRVSSISPHAATLPMSMSRWCPHPGRFQSWLPLLILLQPPSTGFLHASLSSLLCFSSFSLTVFLFFLVSFTRTTPSTELLYAVAFSQNSNSKVVRLIRLKSSTST